MTTVKTTCFSCGDIELEASALTLELTESRTTGRYRFTCPYCTNVRRRPANERVVAILLASGVAYELAPASVSEEEIAAFVAELDDWLEKITAA
jgi:hypothetical protein